MEGILSVLVLIGVVVSVFNKAAKNAANNANANRTAGRAGKRTAQPDEPAEDKKPAASIVFENQAEAVKTKASVPAKKTAVQVKDLRRAVIMNEILGKPVSLRDEK